LAKSNDVKNWDESYRNLNSTYDENINTPAKLSTFVDNKILLSELESIFGSVSGKKVLEVGCGGARSSVFLAKNGAICTCSDISSEALRLAEDNFIKEGLKGTFVCDDLFNSKLELESYDIVMSFGLLEHFEDIDELHKAINKFVKPGGVHSHLVITKKFSTVMMKDILFYPLRFLKNVFTLNFHNIFVRSYRDFPHYENTYSYKEYQKSFEKLGCTILVNRAGGILFPFYSFPRPFDKIIVRLFKNILLKLSLKIDQSQSPITHFFAPTFTIFCQKK